MRSRAVVAGVGGRSHAVMAAFWLFAGSLASSVTAGQLDAQDTTLVGTLHLVWDADETADNPDGVLAYVVDEAGRGTPIVLEGADASRELRSWDRRRVEVRMDGIGPGPVGEAPVGLERVSPIESVAAASPGVDRWDFITVLCRFADDPAPAIAPSRVERVVGSEYPGMQQYFAELAWDPGIMAGNAVTSVWHDLPEARSYYVKDDRTELGLLANDCTQAAEAEVDFTNYRGINLQFSGRLASRSGPPYDVLSYGGSWTLTLDRTSRAWGMTWMTIGHAENYVVYAHEMGHALGWPHSSGRYGDEYDSNWDVMSRGYLRYEAPWGWLGIHTIAPYKDARGWVAADRRWEPALGTTESATLVRTALPPDEGYLMAVIARGPDRSYTAEARRIAGHDGTLPGHAVILHEVDFGRAYLVDPDLDGDPNDEGAMWTPGETFTDSVIGLTLHVDGETDTGFEVTITRGWRLDVSATEGGSVRSTANGGIDCRGGTCTHVFPTRGETVQLTAAPENGSELARWTGACAGTGPCNVTMQSNRTVGAVFRDRLLMSAVLGRLFGQPTMLTDEEIDDLDRLGNGNGRFDLGDVRAWLMDSGAAATSPSSDGNRSP